VNRDSFRAQAAELPRPLRGWLVGMLVGLLTLLSASQTAAGDLTTDTDQARKLRVYCTWRGADYAPFHRWDYAAPAPVGFEPALIARVAKALDMTLVFVEPRARMSNPRIEMLFEGRADAVISTFSITPERMQLVSFSGPYFTDGLGAMVRTGASIQKLDELSSKRLFVVHGTTGEAWVRAHWPQARLVPSIRSDEATAVANGQVDGYVNDRTPLVRLASADRRVRVLPGYLTQETWGIAVMQYRSELLRQLSSALDELESSGELAALRREWLGAEP
jgi:ABC-type amino acid transport substrate-binding protein